MSRSLITVPAQSLQPTTTVLATPSSHHDPVSCAYLTHLTTVAAADVAALKRAQESYGNSWKKRGGVGAFMMLARKWDRLEQQVSRHGYDIFALVQQDTTSGGPIDDIRDLRRYLMLVEAELLASQVLTPEVTAHTADPAVSSLNQHLARIQETIDPGDCGEW